MAGTAQGVLVLLLLLLNSAFWSLPFYVLLLLRFVLPEGAGRGALRRGMARLARGWLRVAGPLLQAAGRVDWDVEGVPRLRPGGLAVVTVNHVQTVDVFALVHLFHRNGPVLKFFLKRELIWLPFIGVAMWGLDFPFLKRHSKEELERRPERRGEDLAVTRKSLERFRSLPGTVVLFPEGTRFTPGKRDAQGAPHRYLLRPRAGGLALALSVLGDRVDGILDLTLAYPDPESTFWRFLCGRVGRIRVRGRRIDVPPEIAGGDYEGDPEHRRRFQEWLGERWREKDEVLAGLDPPGA